MPGNAVNPSYSYNANGNMASGGGRTYTWTAFEQPSKITQAGAAETTFLYDDAHSRVKETAGGTATVTINPRLDLGHGFQRVIAPTQTTDTIYVSAMGRPVATIATTTTSGTARSTRWLHADALGSVVAVTDADGEAVARYAYDAWGLRLGWAASGAGERRGYTGHETLEGMGLVNMNGRLYDPALARFVSADPFVPNPDDWQSYNRYSYVLNNPFLYTDPSGYFHLGTFLKQVASVAIAVWAPEISGYLWSGMGGTFAGHWAVQATTAGFLMGGVQGGTLKAALNGAGSGLLSAGLFNAAGTLGGEQWLNVAENSIGRAVLHGVAGCVNSAASGGKCGNGFVAAAFTQFASQNVMQGASGKMLAVKYAIIGGTASVLTGGKFANGAVTGTFQYLFNQAAHGKPPYETRELAPQAEALGIETTRLTETDFQSVQGKHGPMTNRGDRPNSIFDPDLIRNYETFVDKVVNPALGPGAAPLTVSASGSAGQIYWDRTLPYSVGTSMTGVPTNTVRLVLKYDWGLSLSQFSSIWRITGAYPK